MLSTSSSHGKCLWISLVLISSQAFLAQSHVRNVRSGFDPSRGGESSFGCGGYQKSKKKVTFFSIAMDHHAKNVQESQDTESEDVHTRGKRQTFLPDEFASIVRVSCDQQSNNEVASQCDIRQPYRTITGECNNLRQKMWGAANIRMRRYVDPVYADGLGVPRGANNEITALRNPFTGTDCSRSAPDSPLPNPRLVSSTFHTSSNSDSLSLTHMITQFGQFLDHDLTFTPESALGEDCCNGRSNSRECFPIRVLDSDRFFGQTPVRCINFGRSSAFCLQPDAPREQMNTVTAFVDASNTYGSSASEERRLRLFQNGLLKTSFQGRSAREFLPVDNNGFFMTGDVRGTEMPGLAAMHTLFVREHNRIARQLQRLSVRPKSDEELFQETRRILIAEYQNIVYSEYLPLIMGARNTKRMVGFSAPLKRSSYNPTMDPSVRNSFATAVFRFGHSQVQGIVQMMFQSFNSSYDISDHFFRMDRYLANDGAGMEAILQGLTAQKAAQRDRFVTDEVTNQLFPGIDLVARNIQRGRDHGLPGYNDFREFCGMPRSCSWSEVPAEMSSDNWRILSTLYTHPNDIDLYTAGIAEVNYLGGALGRTFSCVFGRQFKAMMDGDRFFYTHGPTAQVSNPFNDQQLKTISRRTLRDILCENTGIQTLQENVFLQGGEQISCRRTNSLNLDLFV